MAGASQGVFGRLCTEPGASPHTFDTGSEPFEFLSESIAKHGVLTNPNGIRGTRSPCYIRTRKDAYRVGGSLHMNVTPADLLIWLERAMGGTPAAGVIALAETIPSFGILVDRVAQTFQYKDCFVDKLILRGRASSSGQTPSLVDMHLEIVGTDEVTGTSYPAVSLDCTSIANQPLIFSDGVLTLASSSRQMMNFALMIDNHIESRWTNSLTATSHTPTDRTVMLRTTNPFTSSELALYEQAPAGAAGTLALTNGTVSVSFAFAQLQVPPLSPTIGGKREIPLYLNMISRMSGTRELIATLDTTP